MATQYSTILKLALPTQGELSGTWGDVVNDNITSMVEEAIAGRAVINTWAANSHTLTTANGTTSESRCAMLEFTDTGTALTGAGTVVCPTASKIYICKNDAGQTVTIKTSAGTGVAIADGETKFVFCDGTNVVEAVTSMATLKVGTGVQVSTILDEDNMASDSATALATQQSIKAYVDSQVTAQDLDIAGDTGTGAVDLDSQSLTVAGTANEIETAASGQTITVGLPSAIIVTTSVTTPTVQVTNINANDSTTAITIADSTGQVTVADAVLTTADINGGTADNVIIGGSTPAAGSFTTLGASGTTSLGGALALTGNLDINTNKFNVTAADGNTLIAGTLDVTGNVDLNGGTIDGTVIGGSTAAAGSFTTLTASGEITANAGIALPDNQKATFGASDDLQIYHDGSNSYIQDAGTGNLFLQGTDLQLRANNSMRYLTAVQAAEVKLYYNNSQTLATTATGIDVTGEITADGIALGDGDKATFGASDDLQIYHDGSHSFISDVGVGRLYLQGTDGVRITNASAANMISAVSGDGVYSYYNGGLRLATTATGIDVTGTVTADGLTVDLADNAGVLLQSPNDSSTAFLKFGDSTSSDSGSISYDHFTDSLRLKTTNTNRLVLASNGDVSFYDDTGSTAKFFWDASAESLGIGTTNPSAQLELSSATGATLRLSRDDTTVVGPNSIGLIEFYTADTDSAGVGASIEGVADGSGGNVALAFSSGTGGSASEAMRIDSSGNLLVGTTTTSNGGHVLKISSGTVSTVETDATAATNMIVFRNGNGNVGNIQSTGSTTAYNTSSDQRLKDNIVDAPSSSDDIDAIQVRSFDWKADGSHQKYGMIAQELMTVAPEAVSGDPESDEMMGVDYSKLVPMLVKEIQLLRARVAQLETN